MHPFQDSIFFIGSGAMAEALIRGMTEQQAVPPENIRVINRNHPEQLTELQRLYGVVPAVDLSELANSRFVVLATKPADCRAALAQAQPYLRGQLLISLCAGVTMGYLRQAAGEEAAIVRTMPNIPAAVMEGVTAVSFDGGISQADKDDVLFLLRQVGDVVEIPESMMDAVTAVSGSGPGFVCYFLEAMEAAAAKLGFAPDLARRLVLQTVIGTAMTLSEWGLGPQEMRQRVTSRGGTTQAGVEQLTAGRIDEVVDAALQAAARRSAELGRTYAAEA